MGWKWAEANGRVAQFQRLLRLAWPQRLAARGWRWCIASGVLVVLGTLAGCETAPAPGSAGSDQAAAGRSARGGDAGNDPSTVAERAATLAQKFLIVDTHIDVPFRLHRRPADIGLATEDGEFDYPRAVQGGLNAAFMSIYIPASVDESGGARALADKLIDDVEGWVARWPGKFAIATSPAEVRQQRDAGVISLPLGMENGGPIEGSAAGLQHFYNRGVRYVTLAHSKSNHLSDSSYDLNERWGGLSPFGREAIGLMNDIGMMIDVSHISDQAFWQVLALSRVPVIASHSSARRFTPGFHRNMSDEMISAIGAAGGVVQINFGSSFVTAQAREWSNAMSAARIRFNAEHPKATAEERTAFGATYLAEHPFPFATLDNVLDHIDLVVELAGIDAAGIGSDFDGVGNTLPIGLKDVAAYPALVAGLLGRGYGEDEIEQILGGNLLSVWTAVEAARRPARVVQIGSESAPSNQKRSG